MEAMIEDPGTDQRSPAWPPELRRQLLAWLSLPRDKSAELIGGRIVYKAMATLVHGAAQGGVFAQIFKQQGPFGSGTRWWLTQDADMYIGGEGMRPDVAGWRIERHPQIPPRVNVNEYLGVIVAPPDWVCEVLSKSTRARDRGLKWKAYQRAGVEWYWLVDVLHESLTVYRRTDRSYEIVEEASQGDVVRLPPFEEVEIQVSPLFINQLQQSQGGGTQAGT